MDCIVGEYSVYIVVLKVCVDFGEIVSCIYDVNVSLFLSHGAIITDRLFFQSFNSVFSFNVKLLYVFQHGVLIDPNLF